MSRGIDLSAPFLESAAAPLTQPELAKLRDEFRIQGQPMVRWTARETRGGGFGSIEDHPYAWGVWVMADGQWRRVVSARGKVREWTSLDRVALWLTELGFQAFSVSRDGAE